MSGQDGLIDTIYLFNTKIMSGQDVLIDTIILI